VGVDVVGVGNQCTLRLIASRASTLGIITQLELLWVYDRKGKWQEIRGPTALSAMQPLFDTTLRSILAQLAFHNFIAAKLLLSEIVCNALLIQEDSWRVFLAWLEARCFLDGLQLDFGSLLRLMLRLERTPRLSWLSLTTPLIPNDWVVVFVLLH